MSTLQAVCHPLNNAVNVQDIETLFNGLFMDAEQTVLRSGADEPLYLPVAAHRTHAEIHARADYLSSALHEISHWCIAGKQRRQLEDYGYWYEPDGRDARAQKRFEQVEVKPQALEWLFSEACGQPFRLSVDNVAQPELRPGKDFAEAVTRQANRYLEQGLPDRAKVFFQALQSRFGSAERFERRPFFQLDRVYWQGAG